MSKSSLRVSRRPLGEWPRRRLGPHDSPLLSGNLPRTMKRGAAVRSRGNRSSREAPCGLGSTGQRSYRYSLISFRFVCWFRVPESSFEQRRGRISAGWRPYGHKHLRPQRAIAHLISGLSEECPVEDIVQSRVKRDVEFILQLRQESPLEVVAGCRAEERSPIRIRLVIDCRVLHVYGRVEGLQAAVRFEQAIGAGNSNVADSMVAVESIVDADHER